MEQCVPCVHCTQTAVGRSVTTLGWPIHLIQPEERFHGAPESRRVAGAPTCRHEPPKPAVIEQAARGVCGVGSGGSQDPEEEGAEI